MYVYSQNSSFVSSSGRETMSISSDETDRFRQIEMPMLVVEVQGWLGASRSSQMKSVCSSWAADLNCHAPNVLNRNMFAGIDKRQALLRALGAPLQDSNSDALGELASLTVEDDVFSVMRLGYVDKHMPEMLTARSEISDPRQVCAEIEALRPICKLPAQALDELFQPCFQREKTLYLSPRPLQCAVIRSSARITSFLLAAARDTGVLQQVLEMERGPSGQLSLSPIFLAVLFADQQVANALKHVGAATNGVDVQAAMRLQRAGLWDHFQERAKSLGLHVQVQQLSDGIVKLREEAKRAREAVRRALLSK